MIDGWHDGEFFFLKYVNNIKSKINKSDLIYTLCVLRYVQFASTHLGTSLQTSILSLNLDFFSPRKDYTVSNVREKWWHTIVETPKTIQKHKFTPLNWPIQVQFSCTTLCQCSQCFSVKIAFHPSYSETILFSSGAYQKQRIISNRCNLQIQEKVKSKTNRHLVRQTNTLLYLYSLGRL
jgi:hypothetical protein